jgi:2-polyprenyl-6-methoxyphenol hydroxylase-like FAD-dependent oxidoreductase
MLRHGPRDVGLIVSGRRSGGGPTGLMLAGELALAGVGVVIVERRAGRTSWAPRARNQKLHDVAKDIVPRIDETGGTLDFDP